VGFEPTIPASERGKIVHALERSATMTGTTLPVPFKKRMQISNQSTCKHKLGYSSEWNEIKSATPPESNLQHTQNKHIHTH
jgi:hypothetical protein